ncbi:MAG: hypothetical protein BGO69_10100 [Bacteroidetes bacterium 46-16]|nr:MAG: hypothetical protein BGO69_10100 [Bacteroidetes bacterium 46-16]
MQYIWEHIKTILDTYKGGAPLSYFLKTYFKQYPILGSRDRKILSEMTYNWYRCEKGMPPEMPFEEKIYAALYLCGTQTRLIEQVVEGPLQSLWQNHNPDRIAVLDQNGITFHLQDIFPFEYELSEGLGKEEWLYSLLVQPDLFLRVRKKQERMTTLLHQNGIAYHWLFENCMALPNGVAIDKILQADDYVVQDASSQLTGNYFHPCANETWYDCCSGAGGKSLLLKDMEPEIELFVSDKRGSILDNLEDRFRLYHHKLPESFLIDCTDPEQLELSFGDQKFNGIIADVPCTGSGTWARTPEQMYFYDPAHLENVSALQRNIVKNVAEYLEPDGRLIYITCSVFRQENEAAIAHILSETSLQLEHTELIKGIEHKADSMFVSVLRN